MGRSCYRSLYVISIETTSTETRRECVSMIHKIVHWAFAVFISAIAFLLSIALSIWLTLRLGGFHVPAPPSADLQSQSGPFAMSVMAGIILFLPPAAATFVGAMTAPFAQRGIAAVVFPVLVFAAITLMPLAGHPHQALNIARMLETAANCAVPGGLVYLWWRRQQSRIARAKPGFVVRTP